MPTIKEKLKYNQLINKSNENEYDDLLKRFFKRSFKLQYGDLEFESIISFDADDIDRLLIFDNACDNFYICSKEDSKAGNIIGKNKFFTDLDELANIFS